MSTLIFYISLQNPHLIFGIENHQEELSFTFKEFLLWMMHPTFLPLYLRFVRGIIDTSDLPLNVSQRDSYKSINLVDSIKKAATKEY